MLRRNLGCDQDNKKVKEKKGVHYVHYEMALMQSFRDDTPTAYVDLNNQ